MINTVGLWPNFEHLRKVEVHLPMSLAMKANIPPHEWWDLVGEGGIHLAPLAKSILAHVYSSSSCKKNWSSYTFVHNKTTN